MSNNINWILKKATIEGKEENILCEIMQYIENNEIRSKDVFENPR